MKPFDLGKAKSGHPVCTREGRKARILAFDLVNDYPIVCAVQNGDYDDKEVIITYNEEGISLHPSKGFDLMLEDVIHKKYIVLKKEEGRFRIASDILFPTVELAKCYKRNHKDATTILKIEWEE